MTPERGDVIRVEWADIQEDPVGDPQKANLPIRASYGLFWEKRLDSNGIDVLVTTTTIDPDGPSQSGFCIYPIGCVRSIHVIKKARKGRKAKANGSTTGARKAQSPRSVSRRDALPVQALQDNHGGESGEARGSAGPLP